MPIIHVSDDDDFKAQMAKAGQSPVVVDFFAEWCGPCKFIAPKFEEYSNKYPNVVFLKVDVDVCEQTAATNGIQAMPTFLIFVGGKQVDSLRGANAEGLEAMIKKYADAQPSGEVPGQIDLTSLIDKSGLECLNNSDETSVKGFIEGSEHKLVSDCDEQLIIAFPFNQPVKIHSIGIKGNGKYTPKSVYIFQNLPKTLDFDGATGLEPTQILEFGEKAQTPEGEILPLKYVKFQNVRSLQLFIKDNQGGDEVTDMRGLKIYGTPLSAVNMNDFKRVAGKAGESAH